MADLNLLKSRNAARWANAKITRDFSGPAKRLVAAKNRYLVVEKYTGLPWYVVAVIHEREASQNFNTQLGQGDPLHEVSVHVPKGRGPFETWEAGAFDALSNCQPYTAKNHDWSVGGMLTQLELYNGLGYANRGMASPYVWSGTNQYVSGKYVRDGVYDAQVVDKQLGCAGLLMAMMDIDKSIVLGNAASIPSVTPPAPSIPRRVPSPPLSPLVPPPVATSWISKAISAIMSLFKKRS